jgi:hypothetical protein
MSSVPTRVKERGRIWQLLWRRRATLAEALPGSRGRLQQIPRKCTVKKTTTRILMAASFNVKVDFTATN